MAPDVDGVFGRESQFFYRSMSFVVGSAVATGIGVAASMLVCMLFRSELCWFDRDITSALTRQRGPPRTESLNAGVVFHICMKLKI